MRCRGLTMLGFVLSLACSASAAASITLGTNAQRPALRVDARGNAEVSWTAGGVRRYVFVPPTGRVYPGRRLTSADVSRSTASVALPFRKVLRRTPDGRLWAVQVWRVKPGGPTELRFSRWRGLPPQLTVASEPRSGGDLVSGRATFGGRAVPLFSPTPEGRRLRSYAYVDGGSASGWSRISGVATAVNGSFRLLVPSGKRADRYRLVLPGPNVGATLAPDAAAVVPAR